MSKDELRKQLVQMYSNGKSVDEICCDYNIPKSTFYRWIRKSKDEKPVMTEEDLKIIIMKIAELEEETTTYKKVLQALRKAEW
jgi:transposase-like protein